MILQGNFRMSSTNTDFSIACLLGQKSQGGNRNRMRHILKDSSEAAGRKVVEDGVRKNKIKNIIKVSKDFASPSLSSKTTTTTLSSMLLLKSSTTYGITRLNTSIFFQALQKVTH